MIGIIASHQSIVQIISTEKIREQWNGIAWYRMKPCKVQATNTMTNRQGSRSEIPENSGIKK